MCALIASIGSLGLYFRLPVKSDWRGASALLAREAAPDDLILHYPPYLERSIRHYLSRPDVTIAPFPLDATDPEQFRRRLTVVLGSRTRFWLVTAYLRENPEEIARSLTSWFPRQQRKDVPGIAIFELQR